MKLSQESIFSSALRSFFNAVFAMVGITFGVVPLLIVIGALLVSDGEEIRPTSKKEMLANADGTREALKQDTPLILKLTVSGFIGGEKMDTRKVKKVLQESREGVFADNRVQAILLDINTPGGTVFDADGIYRAIKEYKERYDVPVFAYVDGLCASGGMYIASAADKIYASETSLIGSVGVILNPFFNIADALEKFGVKAITVSAGKSKDAMNPTRQWESGEEKNFVMLTDHLYQRFVDIVAKNRPRLDQDMLINEYGARVFPAPTAVEYGYVDVIEDSESKVIEALVTESGINPDTYQVVELEPRKWLSDIFSEDNTLLEGKLTHKVEIPGFGAGANSQFLYFYHPGLM